MALELAPFHTDVSLLQAMEAAVQFQVHLFFLVHHEGQLHVNGLAFLVKGQVKVGWLDIANEAFHKGLLLLEKGGQVILEPGNNKSWVLLGVDYSLLAVFRKLLEF